MHPLDSQGVEELGDVEGRNVAHLVDLRPGRMDIRHRVEVDRASM